MSLLAACEIGLRIVAPARPAILNPDEHLRFDPDPQYVPGVGGPSDFVVKHVL